ncbi:MAG TPA: hypothetical protein PKM19_06755 [Pseudomonadales bacterium]|nr:hypothetical protein [Pseudomonadales bacterium]HNN65906.1 hypothetical protein [Pseudomonadales bacterium]
MPDILPDQHSAASAERALSVVTTTGAALRLLSARARRAGEASVERLV